MLAPPSAPEGDPPREVRIVDCRFTAPQEIDSTSPGDPPAIEFTSCTFVTPAGSDDAP
jgi:hypothetical protein